MDDETPRIGDNSLRAIDPHKLLLIEGDDIAPFLAIQFPDLSKRSAELLATALDWIARHTDHASGLLRIESDADQNKASEIYTQLADHAGSRTVSREGRVSHGPGELKDTRDPIVEPLRLAIARIDHWFSERRMPISDAMGTIQAAQNAYADACRRREQLANEERERAARAEAARVAVEERQAADAARQLAAEEAEQAIAEASRAGIDDDALMAALEAERIANEQARLAEQAAAQRIARAKADAEAAARQAKASVADLTRTKSVTGITSSLVGTWTWALDDMMELCRGIVAGEVPASFITTADTIINASIRGRTGMRRVRGLTITQQFNTRRHRSV